MLNAEQAAQLLSGFDHILVLTHKRPDGDTVGCAAALCAGLKALGKDAWMAPNAGLTETTAPYAAPYLAPVDFVPEKIVSVDVATADLLPESMKQWSGRVDLAIDHHPSFTAFGRENAVRSEAAACGELIYDILKALTPITAEIALPLYLAISTDTGCFVYSNTTPNTHRIAAALMETGIDYKHLNKTFFQTKSRKRMQLEAAMLAEAKFYDNQRVAVLAVPLSLMERFAATETDAEDLSALGPQIQGVDCAITLKELRENVWKVSLRTGPRVNATKVCGLLGGGGHAAAAGCTIEAPYEEAKARILDAVSRFAPDFQG